MPPSPDVILSIDPSNPSPGPAAAPAGSAPALRPLISANLAAQAAEQMSLAAVPMVAVLMLGAGTRETGLIAAAQSLPFLLLALPFGLLADRASRRQLMVRAEALRVLAMLGLAGLAWAAAAHPHAPAAAGGPATSPWLTALMALAALGFVGAVGTVAFSVAAPALVARLVPREGLARANGQLELARSLAFAAGPALAGAIVAAAGGAAAFVLAAAMSAWSVMALLRLPPDEPPGRPAAPGVTPGAAPSSSLTPNPPGASSLQAPGGLAEGARFVWLNRWLRPVLLTAVVWNLSWMVLQAAYVPHATAALGMGARGIGFTLSLYGLGMVLGAAAAPRLMGRLPLGQAIVIGPLVSVAAALTMAATVWWPTPALAALSFFLFGAGPIVWTVSSTTLRQALTPHAMLGRVSSIFLTANAGARPLGAALGAAVAVLVGEALGASACLVLAAAGFVLQAVLVMASPLRTLQRLPQSDERAAAA